MDSKKRKSTIVNRYSLISNLDTSLDDNLEEIQLTGSKRKVSNTQAIKTFCRIRPIDGKNGQKLLT